MVDDLYFPTSWLLILFFLTFMVADLCFQPPWLMILVSTFRVDNPCSNLRVADLFPTFVLFTFVSNLHGWWFISNLCGDELFPTIRHPCQKGFNWNLQLQGHFELSCLIYGLLDSIRNHTRTRVYLWSTLLHNIHGFMHHEEKKSIIHCICHFSQSPTYGPIKFTRHSLFKIHLSSSQYKH